MNINIFEWAIFILVLIFFWPYSSLLIAFIGLVAIVTDLKKEWSSEAPGPSSSQLHSSEPLSGEQDC